ncbi:MAG: hypothetical protein ACT4N5_07865 [Nitrosopumilaceae archaeon]
MNSKQTLKIAIIAIVASILITGTYNEVNKANAEKEAEPNFEDSFDLETCSWSTTGSNPYFVLQPGYQLVLKGKEGNSVVQLTITVLDETKTIQDIPTRIVEESETKNGQLVEISRNYFSICTQNNNVFYFGEDVDIYQDGRIVSHDGAWIHGKDGARAGLMMPGSPIVDYAYYQEIAPGVALDRAEIESLDERVKTPAGVFEDSLEIFETTPLEPNAEDFKWYAPGIGLVKSNTLKLVQYGYI